MLKLQKPIQEYELEEKLKDLFFSKWSSLSCFSIVFSILFSNFCPIISTHNFCTIILSETDFTH